MLSDENFLLEVLHEVFHALFYVIIRSDREIAIMVWSSYTLLCNRFEGRGRLPLPPKKMCSSNQKLKVQILYHKINLQQIPIYKVLTP